MNKFLIRLKPSDVIDINQAKDNMLAFVISSSNSQNIEEDKLRKVLKSVYSYAYHKKQEEGIDIGTIEFLEDQGVKCLGYSTQNQVYFGNLKEYYSKTFSPNFVFDVLDTSFHEIQHTTEIVDNSLKSNNHNYPNFNMTGRISDSIDNYLNLCEQSIGQKSRFFDDHTHTDFNFLLDNIMSYEQRLYYQDAKETKAREFSKNALSDLIEYGNHKELSLKDFATLLEFTLSTTNGLKAISDNISEVKRNELSPTTKKSLSKFLKTGLEVVEELDITREVQKSCEENKANDTKLLNQMQGILFYFPPLLALNYDEVIAKDYATTILALCEKYGDIDPTAFSQLVLTTKYSPTQEEMERNAKSFKDYYKNHTNIDPLNTYLLAYEICYTHEYLLKNYALNNKVFLSDLIIAKPDVNETILQKVKEDYKNNNITFEEDEIADPILPIYENVTKENQDFTSTEDDFEM